MQYTVAFLGLGVMGYPMAGRLASRGFNTRVWNRTSAKSEAWQVEYGGENAGACANLVEAVAQADLVCTCLGNDEDVRSVVLEPDGALAHMRVGALLVDHTTTTALLAREIHTTANTRGIGFVDAPVSGGQSGAEQGQLTIMLGGSPVDYDKAGPVLQSYAKRLTHIGEVGSGQLAKMVNQICIAGVLQGLSEGLVFAKASGLDGEKLLAAIGEGAAQSWQMNNRGATMLNDEFDFGFAVKWMIKDLNYCLQQADECNLNLPVTAMVLQQYHELAANNGGRLDTSSLIRSVAEIAQHKKRG